MKSDLLELDPNLKEKMFSNDFIRCTRGNLGNRPYFHPPHWHSFIELLIVKKGSYPTMLHNKSIKVNEGEIIVIMPGELHNVDFDGSDTLDYCFIQFDSMIFQNAVLDSKEISLIYPYLFNYWVPKSFVCSREEAEKSGIIPIVDNIFREYTMKKLGYSISIKADLLKIFLWLLRYCDENAHLMPSKGNISLNIMIHPVLQAINSKYSQNITTTDMAELLSISVSHFCHLFKKTTGCSFRVYLQSKRVTESIKLLFSTSNNLKQIAAMVGFRDTNFYIRAFKKHTGFSPCQYKKKYNRPADVQ